jgi:hypothetical protein
LTAEQIEYQKMMGKSGAKALPTMQMWVRPSSTAAQRPVCDKARTTRASPSASLRRLRILLAVLVAIPWVCGRHVATAALRFDPIQVRFKLDLLLSDAAGVFAITIATVHVRHI